MTISFRVVGKPMPGGSKRGFIVGGHVNIVDASKNKPWKEAVKFAALAEYQGPLLDEPLAVVIDFFLTRPQSHFGSGRNARKLKPSAPVYPATRPDIDKLTRSTIDALTGVIWKDDSRIVVQSLKKLYPFGDQDREGAAITVETMGDGIELVTA